MSGILNVTLPYPTSANAMFRSVVRNGRSRKLRTDEYDAWRKEAAHLVNIARKAFRIDGPFALYMRVGRPDKRRRDLDNLIKPVSDALVLGGAVLDDCQMARLEAEWVEGVVGVQVTVIPKGVRGIGTAAAHHIDCEWHHDQYDNECTCGAVKR